MSAYLVAEVAMAQVGRKAQGHDVPWSKMFVQRHGHGSKRSYNRCEKGIETRVRRQGKKAAREERDNS
jgi:hypothetical protein